MSLTYKKSGVDIVKGEEFVSFIKKSVGINTSFGAGIELNCRQYKHPIIVSSADGVGTKLKIAFLCNKHNTVGIDLVAMNINDILCTGAKPLFFLDYIATGKLDMRTLKSVMKGIINGCELARCPLIGGETAEMPDFYKKGEYDLSGFCAGVVEKSKALPKTKQIKQGDIVLGIASSGFHSNGFSLIRKAFPPSYIKKHCNVFLNPTRIYTDIVLHAVENHNIKQIAHITGGGFPLKAVKGLPKDIGIVLKKGSWPIPEIFRELQKRTELKTKEMYSTFNMGIGMTMILSKNRAEKLKREIESKFNTPAYIIGHVKKTRSRFTLM